MNALAATQSAYARSSADTLDISKTAIASVGTAYGNSEAMLHDAYATSNQSVINAWKDANGAMGQFASDSIAAVKSSSAKADNLVADAYSTAKAGEQKILVAAVIGVIALVAIRSLGRGG